MSTQYATDVQAIDALAGKYQSLRQEISKVIVGQDEVVRHVLICVLVSCARRVGKFWSARGYSIRHPVPLWSLTRPTSYIRRQK